MLKISDAFLAAAKDWRQACRTRAPGTIVGTEKSWRCACIAISVNRPVNLAVENIECRIDAYFFNVVVLLVVDVLDVLLVELFLSSSLLLVLDTLLVVRVSKVVGLEVAELLLLAMIVTGDGEAD